MRERKRAQEDAINEAEDGCRRADSECQSEDDRESERRAAAKIAKGKSEILQRRREHGVIMTGQGFAVRCLEVSIRPRTTKGTKVHEGGLSNKACRSLRKIPPFA